MSFLKKSEVENSSSSSQLIQIKELLNSLLTNKWL